MSDVTPPNVTLTEIELLPQQLKTTANLDVRPFSSLSSETEDKHILELALMLETVGQLDACIITPDHILIAGHRRRRAALIINERRSARGQALFRLRCKVDASGGDLRRKGIISNLHRKDLSPMDLAYLITRIRHDNHWEGASETKHVATYLGIHVASVTQHERLLCAERDLQNKIHEKVISAQSAFDLLKAGGTAEDRAAILRQAAQYQEEERTDRAMESYRKGKMNLSQATEAIAQAPKTRIEHPAVIRAIRERRPILPTNPNRLSLTRTELVASIAQFDSELYPVPSREFAHYWTKVYAQGLGSEEELRSKFLAMVEPPIPARKPVASHAKAS